MRKTSRILLCIHLGCHLGEISTACSQGLQKVIDLHWRACRRASNLRTSHSLTGLPRGGKNPSIEAAMLQDLLEGNETFFAQRLPGCWVHEFETFCSVCGRGRKLVAGWVCRPQRSNGELRGARRGEKLDPTTCIEKQTKTTTNLEILNAGYQYSLPNLSNSSQVSFPISLIKFKMQPMTLAKAAFWAQKPPR